MTEAREQLIFARLNKLTVRATDLTRRVEALERGAKNPDGNDPTLGHHWADKKPLVPLVSATTYGEDADPEAKSIIEVLKGGEA